MCDDTLSLAKLPSRKVPAEACKDVVVPMGEIDPAALCPPPELHDAAKVIADGERAVPRLGHRAREVVEVRPDAARAHVLQRVGSFKVVGDHEVPPLASDVGRLQRGS
jgi:hypothetical protein